MLLSYLDFIQSSYAEYRGNISHDTECVEESADGVGMEYCTVYILCRQ